MILVHVALHKSQAILYPIFIVMNAGRLVKEISFKNRIRIVFILDICITEHHLNLVNMIRAKLVPPAW